MEDGKKVRIEVGSKGFVIPGAIASAILVLGTAVLFLLIDDPRFATYASLGLVAVAWLAKAWDVNFSDVLTVVGKTEEDLPDTGFPLPAASPYVGEVEGIKESPVKDLKPEKKVSTFLFG